MLHEGPLTHGHGTRWFDWISVLQAQWVGALNGVLVFEGDAVLYPLLIPQLSHQHRSLGSSGSFKLSLRFPTIWILFAFQKRFQRGNPKCGESRVETPPAFAGNKTPRQQDKTFVSLLFCHRMCKRTLGLGSRAQLSLVAREILVTRDATEIAFFSSLCTHHSHPCVPCYGLC